MVFQRSTMTLSSDEEIIKKRLISEGDSGFDDRRLQQLMRAFLDKSTVSKTTDISILLAGVEHAHQRSLIIQRMNDQEQEEYAKLEQSILDKIDETKRDIIELREKCQEAQQLCQNSCEYDTIAKQIIKYPERADLISQIEALEKAKQNAIEQKQKSLEDLNWFFKQFKVLLRLVDGISSESQNQIEKD
ncbi:hypothetical protein GJ496_003194 [Pomphorhynchus laevis]|nr:hypothetical protein GJ496_003194 [Pomphorhynchus laevis]